MILEMGVLLNYLVILVLSVTCSASGFVVYHWIIFVFCKRFGNEIVCANWISGWKSDLTYVELKNHQVANPDLAKLC